MIRPMPTREPLADLRVADLLTYLAVHRHGSIAAAARALGVTTSQVSKAIVRLEAILRTRLVARTGRGIAPTESARKIVPELLQLVTGLRRLRAGEAEAQELTIAAPSYLSTLFLPALAASHPHPVRGIDLPPALIRAYAAEKLFDVALTVGAERLLGGWVNALVGRMRHGLFAARALADRLGSRGAPISAARLDGVPFITPVYFSNGQVVPGDDDCPLTERQFGHKVQTLVIALDTAACTGQLVFGPVIAARRHLVDGSLVEVAVEGWAVHHDLYLATSSDRVLARTQRSLLAAAARTLSALN